MAERNAINVLIKLLGGKEMVEELVKLGETGEKAIHQIDAATKNVNLSGIGHDLSLLAGDVATFATRAVLGITALKVAADGVVAVLFELAKSSAESADEAGKAAQAAGLSAKAYQEWAFAAESVGVSQEGLSTALNTFNKQVTKTADETVKSTTKSGKALKQFGVDAKQANADITQGAGYTVQAFKDIGVEVTRFGEKASKVKAGTAQAKTGFDELGISVKNSGGTLKTNEQLLLAVATAFQKMPDGARKSQIALKLFGLEGAKLIPLLDQGAAGIEEFKKKAAELGIIFDDDQIKAAAKFNDALLELQKAAGGVLKQLGSIFVPSFTAGANAFRDLIIRNKAAILDFATNALARAKVLIADFFAALSGRDADVSASGKWIVEWRDAIVGFGEDVVHVVNGVVIPAFETLRKAASLVTDAVNAVFGTNLSGGELLILASITQILGGFQVLRTAIFTTINALSIFSTALLANPWLAVLTVVAGGILLWATRTDEATAALRVHDDLIGKVGSAYDQAGRKVAEMSQQVKDAALIQARLSQDAANKGLSSAIDDAINAIQQFDGLLPHAADKLFEVFKQFQGTKDVEAFRAEVSKIGAENPELGKLAQQFLDITNNAHKLAQDGQESANFIGLLTGKLTDSEFAAKQAALGIAGFSADTKTAATDVKDLGTKVDETKTKVESLGQTITVFRGGGAGGSLTKEVFDVVDGVAHRAEQSKAALDGVASSAQAAGDHIRTVATEVAAVPDALKADSIKPAVDGIVTDINRVKPAADAAGASLREALTIDTGVGGGLAANIDTAVSGVITSVEKMPPAADDAVGGLKDALDQSDVGGGLSANITQTVDGVIIDLERMPPAAQEAATATADPFQQLPSIFSGIFSGLGALVQGGFGNLTSVIRSLAGQIRSEISSIISALQSAVAQVQQLRAQASSSSSSSSGGGGSQGGFAGGGDVRGAGTGTSDSILAWLSNGEFVNRAAAVAYYGRDIFHALNNMTLPKGLLRGLRGFNVGGAVETFSRSMATPRYAGGGLAMAGAAAGNLTEGRSPLHLHFDNGVVIDDAVIGDIGLRKLQTVSLRGARVSAGRAPRRK
ncbi:phage tail tape measure protein [Mesorhizobium sp. B1-1-7]|uniref:phage tail tape measure protein n=1 Tax=Mesorhizobium sp. B1-1-7 TaxID=2589977 RepID=UPI00112B21D4|nr:phage tail tape measure protein [Mesorhizobium sp. B1-1-7]TPN44864.1 phage tail tape measure protein [Mesorhizobium sp. B1-1-7]